MSTLLDLLSNNFISRSTRCPFIGEVEFWILLGNKPVFVSARLDDSLLKFFIGLRNDVDAAEHIPDNVSYDVCSFYQLENPVSVVGDDCDDEYQGDFEDVSDAVKQACLDESNRMPVNPRSIKVRELAEMFSADHVYLVIDFLDRKYRQRLGFEWFTLLTALLS